MKLSQIMRLRRASSGSVPIEVLKKLNLPMPEYVLRHFVHDHGTNWEFQRQYGHLDLHALEWKMPSFPASTLINCSIYPGFQECVDIVERQAFEVPSNRWDRVTITEESVKSWQNNRTWRVPPIFFDGNVVGSSKPLHLIEGHHRIGALTGLVHSTWLPADSMHVAWVGYMRKPDQNDGPWQEVLRAERMPFLDWLVDQQGDRSEIGRIGSHLVTATVKHMLSGSDFAAVMEFAEGDPVLYTMLNAIEIAHTEWTRVMDV